MQRMCFWVAVTCLRTCFLGAHPFRTQGGSFDTAEHGNKFMYSLVKSTNMLILKLCKQVAGISKLQ